jgi:ribonuclease-3
VSKPNFKHSFKNENLLVEALTHKSYSVEGNKNKPTNERLEFLGDSILNFVIAADLLRKFPQESEGLLSKKRASLVNQTCLAELAKDLDLQTHLLFGPGEVKQGSPLNPRILASALEAIIGAVYLDSDFAKAEAWVLDLFKNVNLAQDDQIGNTSDYKTRLQELTQKHKLGTPIYELIHTSGPSHKPHFVISLKLDAIEKARAEGGSKKAAEQKAAEMYLFDLQKLLAADTASKKGESP